MCFLPTDAVLGDVISADTFNKLGRVDRFNQHQPARKTDDG